MSQASDGAIGDELCGIDLGDRRLNNRSRRLISSLAVDPGASINAACEGWAETHAAYQFLDNDKVTPAKLLPPHAAATLRRMQRQAVVLIPQDTTEFDATEHPPRDAKCLNRSWRFGFYEHVQLAITPQGLPLGVVGTESFDREPASLGTADDKRAAPIEEKESRKWLVSFRKLGEAQKRCPATPLVSVGDREADIYELFALALQDPQGPKLLVRAEQDRLLAEGHERLWERVSREEVAGFQEVRVPRRGNRPARVARLEVRFTGVILKPPQRKRGLGDLRIGAVLVREVHAPEKVEPI